METKPTSTGSTMQKQLTGIIIILTILVLNTVMTFVIVSNKTATISETDRIQLKNEILTSVEEMLDDDTTIDPSKTCLEGDEDCLDTVDNLFQTCLEGDEDCLQNDSGAAGGTCLAGDESCMDNQGIQQ